MRTRQSGPLFRALAAGGALVFSLIVMSGPAAAQMPRDRTEIHQMAAQLRLSDQQQQAFIRIVDDFQMSMEAALEKYGVDPAVSRPPPTVRFALRSDLRRNLAQMDTELAAILSAEQLRAFQEIRREQIRMR